MAAVRATSAAVCGSRGAEGAGEAKTKKTLITRRRGAVFLRAFAAPREYHLVKMPELPIYMDHHATTPVDTRVVEAMLPFFTENFGNPASLTHEHGRRASNAVDEARFGIARFF